MEKKTIRILLADDHEIVRRGLRNLLQTQTGWKICGEASNWDEAAVLVLRLKPDIALLDISMPCSGEIATLAGPIAQRTKVLIFTMHDSEELVRELLSAGIQGYVLKSDADKFLISAIKTVLEGRTFFSPRVSQTILKGFLKSSTPQPAEAQPRAPLTARELQITKLLASGKSNKEIANLLALSVKTVETHRRSIMRKAGVGSVVELVHYALRNKIVESIG